MMLIMPPTASPPYRGENGLIGWPLTMIIVRIAPWKAQIAVAISALPTNARSVVHLRQAKKRTDSSTPSTPISSLTASS